MWLAFAVLAISISSINNQVQRPRTRSNVGNCPRLTAEDIGRSDSLSNTGIISRTFSTLDGVEYPLIRVLGFQILCESAGLYINTISSVSLIAEYQCVGYLCPSLEVISYINLDCNIDDSFYPPHVQRGAERVDTQDRSLLMAAVSIRCGECTQIARNRNHCAGM